MPLVPAIDEHPISASRDQLLSPALASSRRPPEIDRSSGQPMTPVLVIPRHRKHLQGGPRIHVPPSPLSQRVTTGASRPQSARGNLEQTATNEEEVMLSSCRVRRWGGRVD